MLAILLVCVGSPLTESDTPRLFLEALASAPPSEWVESMAYGTNSLNPDSVTRQIESYQELSVDPGDRVLEDFDGGYRAIFNTSRWTWRLPGGRIGSVAGTSVVEWRPGGYRWVTVPLFTEKGAEVGTREKLCMGVIAMVSVMLVLVFAIWYAKRRYG